MYEGKTLTRQNMMRISTLNAKMVTRVARVIARLTVACAPQGSNRGVPNKYLGLPAVSSETYELYCCPLLRI